MNESPDGSVPSPREIGIFQFYLSGLSTNEIVNRLNQGKQAVSGQTPNAMKNSEPGLISR